MRLTFTVVITTKTFAQIYDYTVKPGSDAWKKLATHKEMVDITQLPQNYLKQAKTADLLQTCLNYPLLFDMLAYDNLRTGFQEMSKYFNGFRELSVRKDAAIIIFEEYRKLKPEDVSKIIEEKDKGRFSFLFSTLELLIATDTLLQQMNVDQKKDVLREPYVKKQFKEKNKEVFGSTGVVTLSYSAAQILTKLDDQKWKLYTEHNQKAKLFSENMILFDEEVLGNIMLNVRRVLSQ